MRRQSALSAGTVYTDVHLIEAVQSRVGLRLGDRQVKRGKSASSDFCNDAKNFIGKLRKRAGVGSLTGKALPWKDVPSFLASVRGVPAG